MKHIVFACTTDNWFTSETGEKLARPALEVELSQPFSSKDEAERWIEKVYRDHPELLDLKRVVPGREAELEIKGVE